MVEEFWEKRWRAVDSTVVARDAYYWIDTVKLKHVLRLNPSAGRALEVGCGSARISVFLAHRGYEMVCMDLSSQALSLAARNASLYGTQCDLVKADALRLPFKDGAFDMVFSTGLLEHFNDPSPIVAEMVRVLANGGVFWSDIVPARFSSFRAVECLRRRRSVDECFERSFSKEEIATLLQSVGLQSIQVFAAGVMPPLWVPLLSHWTIWQRLHSLTVRILLPLVARLDATRLADLLGFYFFASAKKGSS